MADTKISALTALDNADLAADDVLPIVDTGAVATKKISVADLLAGAPGNPNVQQSDIGTAPNEVPLNQYLGSAAYVDIETLTAGALTNTTYISETEPTLDLNFAKVKALDPRITFARASTGTYWDGKTYAKAEENLVAYSQEFDNGYWTKSGITVTANTIVAPDGNTTAETITADGTTGAKFVLRASLPSTSVGVFSVFAKKGTNDFIQLLTNEAGNGFANFDLNAGTVNSTTLAGTITSVGGGWYRCSVVISSGTSFSSVYVNLVTGLSAARYESNSLSTTVYLWGAQLEQRSAVSSYTPTTTQPIARYQPALQTAASGVARFDHNPVTQESLGLLVEEQRTNLLTYSEDFTNASWTKVNSTITSDTITAPNGTLTADAIVAGTTSGTRSGVSKISTTISLGSNTVSVYLKYYGVQYFQIWGGSTAWAGYANIDVLNGAVTAESSATTSIVDVGNGWYRVSVVFTATTTSIQPWFSLIPSGTAARADIYQGDGYSGIYIWGAQLESGAFPTSYIPTVASQVTRSADAASMTGTNFSSWYRQDEGTLYADYVSGNSTLVQSVFKIEDGSNSNVISLYNDIGSASTVIPGFEVAYNGSTSVLTQHSASSSNSQHKFAGAYAVSIIKSKFIMLVFLKFFLTKNKCHSLKPKYFRFRFKFSSLILYSFNLPS